MQIEKDEITNSHFALKFLIEANIESKEAIEPVPERFINRHLELISSLNEKLQSGNLPSHKETNFPSSGQYYKKQWSHKSVLRFIEESQNPDPIEEVRYQARALVLDALSNGWHGPPYDAIELAKILKYGLNPNDEVTDARISPDEKHGFLIEYNPFQKPTRLNFSIGHEIAHTFFSDCRDQIRNREENPVMNRELEQLCNIIASELQLPYVVFPADANALEDITAINLIELAKKYRASIESMLLAFASAIDRPFATLICTFQNGLIVTDYFKTSSQFNLSIPQNWVIPEESRAYLCSAPGVTESETVQWEFMDSSYNVFYIGLSPMRKETKSRVAILLVPNDNNERIQDRKIKFEIGDVTKPRGDGKKIIAHVVNTSGGLGFGVGKSLAKNYPQVKKAVEKWKENKQNFRLGKTNLIEVSHDMHIVQMLAQRGLFVKDGKIPLDYTALQMCLAELRDYALETDSTVYMPLIGAGQAKGDWNIIEGLIFSELVNEDVKVVIYLLGSAKTNDIKSNSALSIFNEKSTWQKEK